MDHTGHIDHTGHMDHSGHMNHSGMDHSGMDHSDHSDHAGHDMTMAVANTTAKAIMDAVHTGLKMVADSDDGTDHSGHMGHGKHHGTMGTDDQVTRDDMMDHGMSMSFHFGYNETILFDWWSINNIGGLIGSMIGIFILAMLYEGLKYWREHLFRKAIAAVQYCTNVKGNITDENKASQFMEQIIMPPTLPIVSIKRKKTATQEVIEAIINTTDSENDDGMNMLSKDHGIQTLLHMIQMVVSYLLMLIFMTYNVWLCLAVVLGAGVGYFLFGWRKSVVVDITEHCH